MTPKKVSEMSVMVVDDEDKICELIEIFLETSFDFRSIVMAPNANLAMQKLANQEFDVIIVDHNLQGKTGLEFIEQLRDSSRFNKSKIILISGYLNEENVLTAIKLGVRHIVVKPFTREQIVNQVSDILKIEPIPPLATGLKSEVQVTKG
jgi:two-component system chemotaxis response regulator CheY